MDVTVKVSNPANDAESIVIDISRLEDGDKLFWGVSQTVGYQILDSQNNPILGAIAEFTSSDEKIAYFPDKNRNNFISTALGTVTITAKSADKTSVETSKTITLIPSQNQSLHVTSTNPALDINDTHQLTWEIRKNNIGLPAYGFPADNVIFAGYDTDIISVSDTGLITAKKAGTTTITMAVYDGDQPDKLSPELKTICTITVNPAPQTPAITGGDAYQPFTTDTNSPIVTFAIANATGGTWKITGDGELVGPDLYPTVDVRATGVGSFTLSYENGPTIASKTVTTFNAFSGISATDITVLPNSNTNPITATATWGGTAYTSSGYTKTAADYNISTAVKISTTGLDANLAGSANLNIIAGAVTGTYPVTLYCEAMPTVTKSINVNVSSTTPAVPASVVFTSGTPLSIPVNASRQLSWVVKDAGGQTIANAPVTFASSNTAVATVGLNTGYVTAHNTGQAIITIKTANNITATCTINVTSATTVYPTNVTFNHRYDLYIRRGDYYQLSWYFTPSNTTQTDVSFYTGDRYIATVTSYGRIYAQDYGVTTVRIRDISGHEDTVRVHVTDYYYNNDYYDDYYDDYYYWHGSSSSSSSSGSSSVSANKNTTLRASDFNTKNDSATVSAYKNSDGAYEAVLTNQMLDNLYNKNSDFELVIKGNNASVTIPADFEDIASELSSILSKNNLSASNVSFRITMEPENLSRSQQNALLNKFPNASVIGDAVDFRIEVLRTSNSRSLGTLTSFSKPIERTFKLSGNNTLPSSYGVFKINENGEIRFVPHKKTASDKLTVLSRTNSIYFVAENKVSFSDVPSGQWYTSFINNAAAKGLVAGTGGSRYEPDKTVTRAEFANMVVNALDLPYVKNSSPYRDVSSSSWYYEAVSRGNAAGLFDKLSGGDYFNGNQPITREEMASVVAQALKSQGYSQRGNTTLSMVFPNDYTYIASTYQQDVALAYESNILAGMGGGVFSPKTTTTRAQAAKVQLNLLKALKMID